ncbi:MAG TPA: SUMF1/EgtB/PvdO family nonheme iron enzyme [Polyangiaceae bacterium]|nr:SUMF1/EgtB/PvdO family nonheme iron enzyme [Polyangiaceae bacterium]
MGRGAVAHRTARARPARGACGPPSCAAGLTCQGRDCCESLVVPGGTFPMGRSEAGTDACPPATFCASDDQPEHAVTVSSFVLDTFEVTVGRFRAFVDAYGGPPAAGVYTPGKIRGGLARLASA